MRSFVAITISSIYLNGEFSPASFTGFLRKRTGDGWFAMLGVDGNMWGGVGDNGVVLYVLYPGQVRVFALF